MHMALRSHGRYGFIKPSLDAHTLGINSAAELLRSCGYEVLIAEGPVEQAILDYSYESRREVVINWLVENRISRVGISYRLDEADAVNMVGYLVNEMQRRSLFSYQGGFIEAVYFAGLPRTCTLIEREFGGLVKTFSGGESPYDTLLKLGVPGESIPKTISWASKYDDLLMEFGREVVSSGEHVTVKPPKRPTYLEMGTKQDTVVKRLDANLKQAEPFYPLVRAHLGPYSAELKREEAVRQFVSWAEMLAKSGYLDILSIGTSQLTQSNFGEDWSGMANGGGVPINSPDEYREIWDASRPLLVRTYAGTKNISGLARMHEETLNICWHALSLWWFNELDGRGPYDLYTNLKQHIETIKFIAKTNKPFEANIPHHFAFRGADDVTYIVSAYLAAKLAKRLGIKTFILQNMLNTPRHTWGVQDLAKSRALLKLVRSLEDNDFRVILQPRAGLDYFKPDLYEAKAQLAAVTALMDDIEPFTEKSPQIIHVVSYSEASHLATPDIVDESIQITFCALQKYRELRRSGKIEDMSRNGEVKEREAALLDGARLVISAIEESIEDAYSAEGFYKIFAAGFLPVPYLWNEKGEFKWAKFWRSKPVNGATKLTDAEGRIVETERMIEFAKGKLSDAEYCLQQKHRS